MEKFAPMFPGGSNPTSVTPLKLVNLAANNNTGNFTGSFCNCTRSLSPSVPLIILVLFGFFLFICFFCIYVRRRSTNWNDRRPRRNIMETHNIMEAIDWEMARGLEPEVIGSFPIFSYYLVKRLKALAKCSECAVCLSDFVDDDMLRLLPKCSHAFHPECIDKWLFTHTTCPVCRTSLVVSEEYIPTPTDPGLVEPQAPPDEVTVVIDNGIAVNSLIDTSNDEATNTYSLVRARKEVEQRTAWYIATAQGLTPGMHRNYSFLGTHHPHEPSGSSALLTCSKPGDFVGDAGHRSSSERWGRNSVKPALSLRAFSEGLLPRPRGQVGFVQLDEKANLKRKFSWFLARDRV